MSKAKPNTIIAELVTNCRRIETKDGQVAAKRGDRIDWPADKPLPRGLREVKPDTSPSAPPVAEDAADGRE